MKNTLSLSTIKSFLRSLKRMLLQYAVVIFTVTILGLYGFLVYQIGVLSQVEPEETAINEQLGRTKRLKIDQASVDKIEQLEDQNIGVQSLFKAARDNPFQE